MPALVLALAGTAQLIRIMRANLLDELRKPYVVTARAKGLTERRVILKYPVRVALNPFVSTIGYLLPYLVSGSIIVSLVLGLPTVGPLLLQALVAQDMFLAGTIVLLLGVLTVIGTLISDMLLMWIDPRIRLGGPMMARAPPPVPARPRPVDAPAPSTPEERICGGHPVAAHVVALPASTSWPWSAVVVRRLFYLVAVFADFLAYSDPHAIRGAALASSPPQRDPLVRRRRFRPHVYGLKGERDPQTFKRVYTPDPARKLPVRLVRPRLSLQLLGADPDRPPPDRRRGRRSRPRRIFLLGTDLQGRDLWSRLMYGDAHLADHRPGRRDLEPGARRRARRHLRASTAASSTPSSSG